MTKAVFRRLCEKMLAKFTPKPTQAAVGIVGDQSRTSFDDTVQIGFKPKYLEITMNTSNGIHDTVYLFISDIDDDTPPDEIEPLINRVQDVHGGEVRIGHQEFYIRFPAIGSSYSLSWKAFA